MTLPSSDEIPRIAVDEFDLADALGLTVYALRKDQRTERRLPFLRIGGRVVYDLEAVKRAIPELREGSFEAGPDHRRCAFRRRASGPMT